VAVRETVDFLAGRSRDARVLDLVLSVTAEMVTMAGVESGVAKARALALAKLEDGAAAAYFDRMIAALGGPSGFVAKAETYLPKAAVIRPVFAETKGYVSGMDAGAVGHALVELGGGRRRPDDEIDLSVGFSDFIQVGDAASSERPLCVIHARDAASWETAAERIRATVRVASERGSALGPVVKERLARAV
jgi:thymidine phosphorylase